MMTRRDKTYSRREVEAEYNRAAASHREFAKVLWSSEDAMVNRFRLALRELPFSRIASWLDVGCGTGAFQAMVRAAHPQVRAKAIDISAKLLNFAAGRKDTAGVEFKRVDFLQFGERDFDLITCIGVLQKTTFSVDEFFRHAAELLVPGGVVFVDTKHRGWKQFRVAGFAPEPSHAWFRVEELRRGAESARLKVTKLAGYLPQAGVVVTPEESHAVFLIAEKGHGN